MSLLVGSKCKRTKLKKPIKWELQSSGDENPETTSEEVVAKHAGREEKLTTAGAVGMSEEDEEEWGLRRRLVALTREQREKELRAELEVADVESAKKTRPS